MLVIEYEDEAIETLIKTGKAMTRDTRNYPAMHLSKEILQKSFLSYVLFPMQKI